MADKQYLEQLSRKLADEGRLIEAGWVAMRVSMPPGGSAEQINSLRMAYMAGAQHLFSSIVSILDEDAEPTPDDLRRMDLIHKELEEFYQQMKLSVAKPAGRG